MWLEMIEVEFGPREPFVISPETMYKDKGVDIIEGSSIIVV